MAEQRPTPIAKSDASMIRIYEVAELLHGRLHKSRRFVFCRSDLDLATVIVEHLESRGQES